MLKDEKRVLVNNAVSFFWLLQETRLSAANGKSRVEEV